MLAARIILDLQTIVSREVNPLDPCVVTVGSIHGGTKHNIIPNEVKLQLTVRTTKTETRDHVLKAIERIVKAAAVAARAPEPEVKVNLEQYTPATLNDVPLARQCGAVFREVLGAENVKPRQPVMGAEDFGRFSEGKTPIFMYFLGTISKEKYDAAQKPGATPAAGDAHRQLRPAARAEHPHRRADDEPGRDEPDAEGQVDCRLIPTASLRTSPSPEIRPMTVAHVLPIFLSAVALFFASFLSWMMLQLHKQDWKKIPKEDEFMTAVAAFNLPEGSYLFPMAATCRDADAGVSGEVRGRPARNPDAAAEGQHGR